MDMDREKAAEDYAWGVQRRQEEELEARLVASAQKRMQSEGVEAERLSRFDVALWLHWPPLPHELPIIGHVSAVDAAEAVVLVMWAFGLTSVAKVAANDLEGRLKHRAYGVRLPGGGEANDA